MGGPGFLEGEAVGGAVENLSDAPLLSSRSNSDSCFCYETLGYEGEAGSSGDGMGYKVWDAQATGQGEAVTVPRALGKLPGSRTPKHTCNNYNTKSINQLECVSDTSPGHDNKAILRWHVECSDLSFIYSRCRRWYSTVSTLYLPRYSCRTQTHLLAAQLGQNRKTLYLIGEDPFGHWQHQRTP